MMLKDLSVPALSAILSQLLKRNLREWKNLKERIALTSKIRFLGKDDKKIEKILMSEPITLFYVHWLFKRVKDSGKNLDEKAISYVHGLFIKESLRREAAEKLCWQSRLIAGLDRKTAGKIVAAAMVMQELTDKSFQEIFENESAYKSIMKSALKPEEWRASKLILMEWLSCFEVDEKDVSAFYDASHAAVAEREKEIFS